MWFKNVFLKTLRDYRIPILGWGVGMGFTIVSPMASVATLISTPEGRAAQRSLLISAGRRGIFRSCRTARAD